MCQLHLSEWIRRFDPIIEIPLTVGFLSFRNLNLIVYLLEGFDLGNIPTVEPVTLEFLCAPEHGNDIFEGGGLPPTNIAIEGGRLIKHRPRLLERRDVPRTDLTVERHGVAKHLLCVNDFGRIPLCQIFGECRSYEVAVGHPRTARLVAVDCKRVSEVCDAAHIPVADVAPRGRRRGCVLDPIFNWTGGSNTN